jgi:hypothetical protein
MNPSNAVHACCRLFKVQQFLAQGMLPALRIEDAKIALAMRIQESAVHGATALAAARKKAYFACYDVLLDFIKRHNCEVILALESYTGEFSDGRTYLFPHTESGSPLHASLNSKKDLFFSGTVPPLKFRLATFLYYSGLISYFHVMESIAWQKDRRPLMGQMAMQIGRLPSPGFARIITRVKNGEQFGSVARTENLLSKSVIAAVVQAQQKYECPIGRYFIEKGLLSPEKLLRLENKMKLHNQKFG